MKTNIIKSRQAKLAQILPGANLDALVLNPGPSLTYLTGLHFHLSERPVVVIFTPDKSPVIVLPELETAKVKNLPYPLTAFPYGENPTSWQAAFQQAIQTAGVPQGKIGVEPRALRVLELRLLEQAAQRAEFVTAEASVATLRMYKDAQEIAAMRAAVDVAQRALRVTFPKIKIGVTEREIAAELTLQLLRHGSDPRLPFFPIVSGGPNGANPHAVPSERALAVGDLLVIDYGANVDGYFSDITRTFAIGKVEPEFAHIAKIVLDANTAGRSAVRPGITAGEVDRATRAVIAEAGYARYFTHRTGHGLGLEGHEEPYIRGDSDLLLEAGMTFTIEPGIYLPDRAGVRIEDDVVVTPGGVESLTTLPRELIRIVPQ